MNNQTCGDITKRLNKLAEAHFEAVLSIIKIEQVIQDCQNEGAELIKALPLNHKLRSANIKEPWKPHYLQQKVSG